MDHTSKEAMLNCMDIVLSFMKDELRCSTDNLNSILFEAGLVSDIIRRGVIEKIPERLFWGNDFFNMELIQSQAVRYFNAISSVLDELKYINLRIINVERNFLFEIHNIKDVIMQSMVFYDNIHNCMIESALPVAQYKEKVKPIPNLTHFFVGHTFWARILHIYSDGLSFFATNLREVTAMNITLRDTVGRLQNFPKDDVFGVRLSMQNVDVYRAFMIDNRIHMIDYGDFATERDVLEIYELQIEIAKLPPKAVKCRITNTGLPAVEPKVIQNLKVILKRNFNRPIHFKVMFIMQNVLHVKIIGPDDCGVIEPLYIEPWELSINLPEDEIIKLVVTHVRASRFFGNIQERFLNNEKICYSDDILPPGTATVDKMPQGADIMLGKSYFDEQWHRVMVVTDHKEDSSIVSVYYVDIGDSEKLPLSRLLKCPESLKIKEFEGISCQLEGLIDICLGDNELTKTANNILSILLRKVLDVKIVSKTVNDKKCMYIVRILNTEYDTLDKNLEQAGCVIHTEMLTTDSETEDNISEYDITEDDITEDDITEDDITEDDVTEDDVTEDDVTEDDVTEDDVTEGDLTEDDVTEDDTAGAFATKAGSTEASEEA